MQNVTLRDATPADFKFICTLNLAEVHHTSPLNGDQLSLLDQLSCYHRIACVEGNPAAFLLAMPSDASYENDNFAWFARHCARFLYIDRIVVSSFHRGLRLGSLLYDDLFRYARAKGFPQVTCEYNLVPPNEPSRRFHEKFGFREQGTRWAADGSKQVSLQSAAP